MGLRKVSASKLAKEATTDYFSSRAFAKVAGFSKENIGKYSYIIPIGLNNDEMYSVDYHTVKSRKVNGKFKGLKGSTWNSRQILCKGTDDNGEPIESLCCELADSEYAKRGENDKYEPLISRKKTQVYFPVVILGTLSKKLNASVTMATLDDSKVAYLDMSQKGWASLKDDYLKYLEKEDIITEDMSDDEVEDAIKAEWGHVVIQVECAKPKAEGGFGEYQKKYDFYHFSNKKIGEKAEQYKKIVHYKKDSTVMGQIDDFITEFETRFEELYASYTDADLEKYIVEDGELIKNLEAFKNEEFDDEPSETDALANLKDDDDEVFKAEDDDFDDEPVAPTKKAKKVIEEDDDDDFDYKSVRKSKKVDEDEEDFDTDDMFNDLDGDDD